MTRDQRQEIYTNFAIHLIEGFNMEEEDAWYQARLFMEMANVEHKDLEEKL